MPAPPRRAIEAQDALLTALNEEETALQESRQDGSGDTDSSGRSQASTKSIYGTMFEPQIENGRQYADADYYMPNDDAEETRLSVVHQSFLLLLEDRLTMARISDDIERVLDVGTGSGDWAIAMGERYPNAEIVATDISSYSQPPTVPPNVFFQIDDAREEWTYGAAFDLIHIRCLNGAFSNWAHIYHEAFRHLKAGGMIEVVDMGLITVVEPSRVSHLSIYNGVLQSAAEKAGITVSLEHLRKSLAEASGLSVLRTTTLEFPLGNYSEDPRLKMVGKMALIAALEGLESTALRLLTKELGWEPDSVKDLCSKVVQDITRPDARGSIPCQFLIARKLLELE
ncbi:hypothetical protein MMC26_006091 [Xylographa opegraphella]|nr:hypothetical protein [Xylographa opegraphella]